MAPQKQQNKIDKNFKYRIFKFLNLDLDTIQSSCLSHRDFTLLDDLLFYPRFYAGCSKAAQD